jgi:hypothetical protein
MKLHKYPLLFFLVSYIGYSQNDFKDQYASFDEIVGLKNTSLSYGILFKEKYRTLKGNHHYFNTDTFEEGNVKYKNETFYNVPLKYDLDSDKLIVNIRDEFETFSIVLEKLFVKEFTINNDRFINIKESGFNEVLYKSKLISLFKKHQKKKKKKTDKSFLYYKFINENSYSIYFNNSYYKVKKESDFNKIFPKQKKFIHNYFKANKKIRKENFDVFLTQLAQNLSNKL